MRSGIISNAIVVASFVVVMLLLLPLVASDLIFAFFILFFFVAVMRTKFLADWSVIVYAPCRYLKFPF